MNAQDNLNNPTFDIVTGVFGEIESRTIVAT